MPPKIALRIALGGSLLLLLILLLLSQCSFHMPEAPRGHDGDIRVHMSWDFPGDVDLHIYQPNGEHIYYGNMADHSRGGGELDVDETIGGPNSQENAYWNNPAEGTYRVEVVFYRMDVDYGRGGDVTVTVKVNGEETTHHVNLSYEQQTEEIRTFQYVTPTAN